jgi:hypothetical protein
MARIQPRSRTWLAPLVALCLMWVAGCGPSGPEVYKVTGVARRGGEPLTAVKIDFKPAQGRTSWGYTDEEGKFELNFSRDIPLGALPGEHTVAVMIPTGTPGKRHPETPQVLRKYGSVKTSPMKVTIDKDGQFVELDFD